MSLTNIPNKIYLQIGEFEDIKDEIDFNELEVSWCSERIFKSDIVYYLKKKRVKNNKSGHVFSILHILLI